MRYGDFIRIIKALTERADQPTYVSVKPDFESQETLVELAEIIQLSSSLMVAERELHCTIAYSREPMGDPTSTISDFLPIEAIGDEWAIFGQEKKCLVLKLSSVGLRALHVHLRKDYGASHDYPTYEPHVTLCDDLPEGYKLPKTKPNVRLTFTGFETRPLED